MIISTSTKSFIETQFPISKLSKESYKERKAVSGQTLTGIGKWWGRKPLILVRATLLGVLMPSTDNPKKDREIFLKILTMDNGGLWQRKTKNISPKEIYTHLTPRERVKWFNIELNSDEFKLKKNLSVKEREELQYTVFVRLSYDEKLEYCDRPEQIDGPTKETWTEINEHLGTDASNLSELVQQLGKRQFGHVPRVGDAFCGGGSIPFEAARIGCEVYASDLNPVAALLTWAALNITGGGEEVAQHVYEAQVEVYKKVDQQITAWGIEHNENGWRSDAYLYCVETKCPECSWSVPLSPSWIIAEKTRTIAKLVPNIAAQCFEIKVESQVSEWEMDKVKTTGTIKDSELNCPHCHLSTPMVMIRGDRRNNDKTRYGLRMWENSDIVPRPDDVFQERLYCIRWFKTYIDNNGREQILRYYAAPNENDIKREQKVLEILNALFHDWQEQGYIPSRRIVLGDELTRLVRTRGWTHWHHLFNPRQLLTNGLFSQLVEANNSNVGNLLLIGKLADNNSRLSQWKVSQGGGLGGVVHTFANQALNPLVNYGCRTAITFQTLLINPKASSRINQEQVVKPNDCRVIDTPYDIWLTDPPYADAVNYDELSEFFLAWYEKHLNRIFPEWYSDSKRMLAIKGADESFRYGMVDCYHNLAKQMSNTGIQVVMFTHQDVRVWADLALILWSSGLQVTSAWCIATETDSALKEGNYVQGTVLLVLRKQTSEDTAFLDEIYPQVENEVKAQLASMQALEDQEDPNFGDTDYQLASYAAALRVLTKYKNIEDIDVVYELSKQRKKGDESPLEKIIADAVRVACDYLVPKDFDKVMWKTLTPEERFYLKGLDIGSHGEFRTGAYQELARGFGLKDYKQFLSSGKANQTKLKTATEFATKWLDDTSFGASLVRNALFAVREVVRSGEVSMGKNWLHIEVKDYWSQRKSLVEILRYLSKMEYTMNQWKDDANAARLLSGALENDHA